MCGTEGEEGRRYAGKRWKPVHTRNCERDLPTSDYSEEREVVGMFAAVFTIGVVVIAWCMDETEELWRADLWNMLKATL